MRKKNSKEKVIDILILLNLFFQSEIKPEYYYEPFKTTDNNDLEGTAMALEMIYTTHDWPPNTPNLTTTLMESGKSRADLWAFATLVALEQTIERANYACDHDYHVRQQITLLEGRDKCDIKRVDLYRRDLESKQMIYLWVDSPEQCREGRLRIARCREDNGHGYVPQELTGDTSVTWKNR